MHRKFGVSRVVAAAGLSALCAAAGVGASVAAAQPTGNSANEQLPNCAVTTATIGTMDVTEFFGLPGTAGGFGQSFGPMPTMSSATASNTSTATTGASAASASTGMSATTGTTGTNPATTSTATTASTTNTGTSGTTSPSGAPAITAPSTAMSVAQSCIRLEVANPSPGDMLQPGGYVVEGFAFDPTAPSSMGSGITGIQVFLGDPNQGGQIVGAVGVDSTGASTTGQFGLANQRALGFGEQFANSGFSVTIQIPDRTSGSEQSGQEALFVAATAQNGERVGTVAVPISVAAPNTASARTP